MNRIQKVTTALMLCGATFAMGQNLITNPGFESSGAGWTLFTQGGSEAVASVSYPTTGAHGGTRYARVLVTTPAASAAENWHVQFQPPTGWSAEVGATYEFKFWAKSDSSANIHVSVQGSDYTYITGSSFGLTTDWTEYTLTHVSEAEGTNGVRFHVYVAESVNAYDFDDFSVVGTPVGIRNDGVVAGRRALRLTQVSDRLVLSVDGSITENWKAELFDLQGVSLASAAGRTDGSLTLAHPQKAGTYVIRAGTATHSWVRKVTIQ
jgi:hypothetical protein